jgi:hypothetical protein
MLGLRALCGIRVQKPLLSQLPHTATLSHYYTQLHTVIHCHTLSCNVIHCHYTHYIKKGESLTDPGIRVSVNRKVLHFGPFLSIFQWFLVSKTVSGVILCIKNT